ncbi:MAG: hypothetical protein K1X64_11595 [Myxococcaceae bacterium]|nr:hypothetical protein [Myxococcaceae bacterium]
MSEDYDDRGYEDKTYTDDAARLGARKSTPLPWVLLAIAAVAATVVAVVLSGRVSDAQLAHAQEIEKRVAAETRAKNSDERLAGAEARATELESQVQKLTEEREALLNKMKAAETNKAAPAKADVAKSKAAAAKAAAAKKTAAKKKTSKTKRR